MSKICIIGDGGWGTALALVLRTNGHDVTVWGPFENYIDEIRKAGENPLFLPGIALPEEIKWTSDRADAAALCDVVVLAVPTVYFRQTTASFDGLIPEKALVVSVAKGLDQSTLQRMTEVASETLHLKSVAALSGPSHAEEVARGLPTAVCIASRSDPERYALQAVFNNARFRVYTSDDPVGTEMGGALKNVIAIAVGVADGLGFGDNTRAALITRGLAEITRLGCAAGGKASTFAGLSGMGDLIVTCTSRHSRNRSVGERLGRGESITAIMDGMKQVAEGVRNSSAAIDMAAQLDIDMPISREVHAVIHEGKPPLMAVEDLMSRDIKPED